MTQEELAGQCKILENGLKYWRKIHEEKEESILGQLAYVRSFCTHPSHEQKEDEGKTTVKLAFCPNCGKDY